MVETLDGFFRQCRLEVDPTTYSILQFKNGTRPNFPDALCQFNATDDTTVVLPLESVRKLARPEGLNGRDDGWRRITIGVDVPMATAGFFRKFADALADAKIGILIQSGYRWEHVLVHEVNVKRALGVMQGVVERESKASATVRSG